MSATSSTNRRALWPHPYGEMFEDASRKPAAFVNALWRELGREPDALDYLERITGGLAGLDSPFIASMRGATRDGDGRLVLSYERLEGEDLGTILARGPVSVERAIAVLRQLCRGLATAHAAGINHRALGPASVVLVREGPRADAVKILDFGIAGVMGESEPKYTPLLPMTPERLLGFGTHTSEDVYLVGCLGYWMLAGAPPFTADDGDGLRRRHAIEDVAPLRSIARQVPSGIARALEDALVKDPDDRTADLATLELALVEAQRDAGIVTPWDAHLEALSEKARVLGEEPATSGVFQSVSGRGGKRTPSGSHRPVGGNGVAANHSPARTVVAAGPGAREAAATGSAAAPGKMPRPKPMSNAGAKVVRPIVAAPTAAPAKPVEPTPVESKPVEAKPVEAKPVETKPVEAKPVEAKPAIAKPVLKPGEPRIPLPPRTTSTKPVDAKPLAMPAKPVEAKPLTMPAKPVEAKPVEAKPVEAKPVEAKPVEAKPVEAKPVEAKPVEAKPTVIPKPASPARIPPPPKMATRPSSLRTEGPPPPSLLTAKEVAPKEPTPTAATSLVGLSLEDVEALGAGLKLPDPPKVEPTIEPPAEPAIETKADAAIEPPSAPASDDAPTIAIAPAPSSSFEPPVAMPLPLADRTDAEALVVGPEVPPKRPAWLIPGVIGIGLVTVLAFAFSPGSSDAPAPTPGTPTPTATTPTATTPTATTPPPVTPTPVTPTPTTPAPIPEVAVAAPPPTTPTPTIAPTPTPTPTDPVAEKPAAAPIDPLRQNLIRGKEARKRGKSDEAIAAYRAALRIDPSNRTALRELSRLYFDGGNYENAAKYGKQLVAASNASASDRVALGDAYFKLGRTADAKAQYQKAAASGDATAKKRLAKLGG